MKLQLPFLSVPVSDLKRKLMVNTSGLNCSKFTLNIFIFKFLEELFKYYYSNIR